MTIDTTKPSCTEMECAIASDKLPDHCVHIDAVGTTAYSVTEARALKKFSLILLPQLFLLSIFSNLDRTNIGNAKVMGMAEDLQLKGKQFNTVSTVFFPTYIVFEIPWVLAIKRFGISRVFAVSMVGWGVITLGTGFVQSFEQLVAVRVLLGIFEASVIPSIVFTISMIWEPSAQAKPVSVYYLGACTSGAIGGLIAYAVQTMGEQHGLEAWRWLFIIEGIISAVLCSVFLITMPLSPERAWFLDESEREAMRQRKERNLAIRGTDKFDWTYFRHAMTNPLVWLGALALFSNTIPLLGLSIFLPTLLSGLGYKGLQLQYLTIPVWVVGAFFLVLTTFASDKFKRRGFWLMSLPLPTIVGYAMLIGSSNKVVGYVAMFIVGPGMVSYNAIMLAWISSNISPDYKRAVSFPVTTALSNIAGILSSQIYPANQAPRYIQGGWIALAFEVLASICAATIWLVLRRRNLQKDRLAAQGIVDNGQEGDKSMDFRHSL